MRSNAKSDFKIRTGYEPVVRCGKVCEGDDLTKQSFKDDCDINTLVARYQRAGVLPPTAGQQPVYADVSAHDFQEFQFIVAQAKTMFAQLPAEVRYRFNNEPAEMLAFLEDEKNRPEAEKLGLIKPAEKPASGAAVAAPVAPAVPAATPSST